MRYKGGSTMKIRALALLTILVTGVSLHADTAADVAKGKTLFQACAACHQVTGAGIPGVFPPLAGSEWATGSEEKLVLVMLNGITGPVKVTGKPFNSAMPGFGPGGSNWTDDKIAAVATYVRQAWKNKAPAVTVDTVKSIREKSAAGRTKPWTAAELEAIK